MAIARSWQRHYNDAHGQEAHYLLSDIARTVFRRGWFIMPFLVLAILVVLVALMIIAVAYFITRRWW